MRRLVLTVVLALMAVVAVVATAAAGDQVVPLKASLAEQVVATAPPADCGLPNLVVSYGEMSHLGKVEVDIHLGHCEMVGPTEMLMTGTGEVIAANGDELYSPSWTLHLDVVSGAFTFSELELLGGTGRFEHASGALTGSGTFDMNSSSPTYLTGTYTVAGAITNVGSTR